MASSMQLPLHWAHRLFALPLSQLPEIYYHLYFIEQETKGQTGQMTDVGSQSQHGLRSAIGAPTFPTDHRPLCSYTGNLSTLPRDSEKKHTALISSPTTQHMGSSQTWHWKSPLARKNRGTGDQVGVWVKKRAAVENSHTTHTLACGFFLEKSQASPRSDILTCPCSSKRIFAG